MNKNKFDANNLLNVSSNDALVELANTAQETVNDGAIERLIAQFEDSSQTDGNEVEFWLAQDLQRLLEYATWDKFLNVIKKAKNSCETSGCSIYDHFSHMGKMVEIGSGAIRQTDDIKLTRYACYLIAQNGDSRKKPVAFAQTYFAIQTRRQEIRDEDETSVLPESEDQKRVSLRHEIKEHNKRLASAAKGAGVVEPVDFAVFQNFGYKGMYGGLDRQGIQRKK